MIYKKYPCEDCDDFEGIINKIENMNIDYYYPDGNEQYGPFIELTQKLLSVNRKTENVNIKEKESVWKKFMNDKTIKYCLQSVENAFQKQFGNNIPQ